MTSIEGKSNPSTVSKSNPKVMSALVDPDILANEKDYETGHDLGSYNHQDSQKELQDDGYQIKENQNMLSGTQKKMAFEVESPQNPNVVEDLSALSRKKKAVLSVKVVLLFFGLLCHFLFTRTAKAPTQPAECLNDKGFALLKSVNWKMNTDSVFRGFLQISSSLVIDSANIIVSFLFATQAKNMATILQIPLFYGIRGVVQGFFLFRHSTGHIWSYPGVPSLSVPYGKASDYYFSGHCGFVTMMILELYRQGCPKLSLMYACLLPYMAFVLVSARVHYSIDIPVGIMVGAYCNCMMHKYIDYVVWLPRLTLNKFLILKIPFYAAQ